MALRIFYGRAGRLLFTTVTVHVLFIACIECITHFHRSTVFNAQSMHVYLGVLIKHIMHLHKLNRGNPYSRIGNPDSGFLDEHKLCCIYEYLIMSIFFSVNLTQEYTMRMVKESMIGDINIFATWSSTKINDSTTSSRRYMKWRRNINNPDPKDNFRLFILNYNLP